MTPLLWIAVAIFFIVRQFQPQRLKMGLLIGLPLGLAYFGLHGLGQLESPEALAFFSINAVTAVALGYWRGLSYRVWNDRGQAWFQGTLLTLGLWLLSILVRLTLMAGGHFAGLSTTGSMAQLLLLLAINFGAQNLVIVFRSTEHLSGSPDSVRPAEAVLAS